MISNEIFYDTSHPSLSVFNDLYNVDFSLWGAFHQQFSVSLFCFILRIIQNEWETKTTWVDSYPPAVATVGELAASHKVLTWTRIFHWVCVKTYNTCSHAKIKPHKSYIRTFISLSLSLTLRRTIEKKITKSSFSTNKLFALLHSGNAL